MLSRLIRKAAIVSASLAILTILNGGFWDISMSGMAQIVSDCTSEFSENTLPPGLESYIPKIGPTLSLTENPGSLKVRLPNSDAFNHWLSNDSAPQVRCSAPAGDWEILTSIDLISNSQGEKFHAGLIVSFDQFNALYFGIYAGDTTLVMEKSGTNNIYVVELKDASEFIDLKITKEGLIYTFSYRTEGETEFTDLGIYGQLVEPPAPEHIGIFCKSWLPVDLEVDFDYLRVSNM